MEIWVRLHTGRMVVLDASAQDTLADLKRKMQDDLREMARLRQDAKDARADRDRHRNQNMIR